MILLLSLLILSSSCTYTPVVNEWEEKYDLQVLEFNDMKVQRDVARAEVAKLELALIDLDGLYRSKKMIYNDLVYDYKTLLRFTDMAEYIIYNSGIEFVYTGPREIEEW